jgi:polygalacturonase
VLVTASGARYKRLLESPYLNVKWFGAKGDGAADDMAFIQKALDTANARGGGTVYFPKGTYIVSPSGSLRINLRNDVHLLGEGTSSVIKVKDNAGEYGMIFGSNNSGVPIKNVRISNLRVDQNPQGNQTCNIDSSRTDSYYWQFVVGLYNYESIVIDNVTFDPTCGINTITLNNINAKNATITNCRFNFVMAKGDGSYDNSAIYLNGRSHTVSNCIFYAVDRPPAGENVRLFAAFIGNVHSGRNRYGDGDVRYARAIACRLQGYGNRYGRNVKRRYRDRRDQQAVYNGQ